MAKNVYEMVTDRIIEELEKGVIPWKKPWKSISNGAYNRVSKKPYSLLNQLMLKHEGEYATFKQWQEMGGKIKKGAKSEFVVFWKMLSVEEEKDGATITKTIPMLRYYNVFHISQVEGIEPLEAVETIHNEPIEEAEKVKNGYSVRENIQFIEEVGNKAFYSPSGDYICIPCKEQFEKINEYYSTAFHEMIHSTGHKKRLDRLVNAKFGSEKYSKEELVAEIGSAMILNELGIETPDTFENSTAYIQSWLQVLKNDNKFIVSASGKAEKAVKYIIGIE